MEVWKRYPSLIPPFCTFCKQSRISTETRDRKRSSCLAFVVHPVGEQCRLNKKYDKETGDMVAEPDLATFQNSRCFINRTSYYSMRILRDPQMNLVSFCSDRGRTRRVLINDFVSDHLWWFRLDIERVATSLVESDSHSKSSSSWRKL